MNEAAQGLAFPGAPPVNRGAMTETNQPIDILLVEDNPDDIELTLRAFKKHRPGDRIHVVRDGAEALAYLFPATPNGNQDTPRLVLLDLKLPKVTGIEVLRRIKAEPRLLGLAVVVLSSSQQDPDVAECYRLGANSYIVKPVDFDRFAEAVVLLGSYWLSLNHRSPA
jgi:two-component system response regulator